MAQAGYTPIQLYVSTSAGVAPSAGNLANGELAINITDGKLFYKDNGGVVQVLAGKSGTGVVAGSNTQLQFNNNGVFGASSALTWDGAQLQVNGLTVGRGAGAVATNTAVGASALAANTSGADTTAVGYQAGYSNTTGARNTFVGEAAGYLVTTGVDNTTLGFGALASGGGSGGAASNNVAIGTSTLKANTANNNTAVGYYAGYSNTTANRNTYIGYSAGYGGTTAEANVAIGHNAGNSLTTGSNNAFVGGRSDSGTNQGAGFSVTTGGYNSFFGGSAGGLITTGSKNTIVGNYNGNQGGIDIRTASNYIVLSDGDGNPRGYFYYTSSSNGYWTFNSVAAKNSTTSTCQIANAGGTDVIFEAGNNDPVGVSSTMRIAKILGNSRSISAAGTVNQNGADYAEYMTKAGDFTVAKGDLVGINSDGKLTNVFADAISFCVKSTAPGLVGGDNWFTEPRPKDESGKEVTSDTQEYAEWFARMEAARATVDRIAFCGQVPVNVTGATAGQYIIPVNDNGAIKGEAVSNPTFEQYQQAVGKVIAIEQDGRAKIIVKVA